MWRACSTHAPASNKFCIFTKVLHLSEVYRKSELSHLSEVCSRQSTTSHNIIRLLRSSQSFLPETEDEAPCAFCGPSIKPQMPEVFHICFVDMNKSTVYIFISCVYTRREDVCGRVIAAPFTWTSVSACALSDRRYIALFLCSYTFSVLLLHRCVLFVFPLSLYHLQRTFTPRVCMSISVGNRIDGISLFCIETHRSVLFVVTPSSCCPYEVQSERLLQVSACAFLGKASTRMPTVHSSKFCFHIVAVCLWSRRPCHVHRERLPHMSVCVCTSWAKLDENADDIYFSSVFIHIVAYYRSVLFVVALSR